ncbi:MAG TPA: hypothetical protein ENO27_05165, partial [Caldithrix sp.]|nr:hypothetical protein [Caldithrix sp.]
MNFARYQKIFLIVIFLGIFLSLRANRVQALEYLNHSDVDLYQEGGFPNTLYESVANPLQVTNTPSILADIYPGAPSSSPHDLVELNGKIYFVAQSDVFIDLWVYDPTQPVGATNPSIAVDLENNITWSIWAENLISFNGKLYFNFNDGKGFKIWVFDPNTEVSQENPKSIEAYNAGDPDEYYNPVNNRVIDNKIYFTNTKCDTSNGVKAMHSIWLYDPAQPNDIGLNPKIVVTINSDQCNYPIGDLVPLGGIIYFTAYHSSYGREIWAYDKNIPVDNLVNPKLLFEILPGNQDDFVQEVTVLETKLVFQANDGNHGRELWIFDPAKSIGAENPKMVKDIYPNSPSAYPYGMEEIDGNLFFIADDGEHGHEYWLYNPNQSIDENNPKMIWDILPGSGSGAANFIPTLVPEYYGNVFFKANDGETGIELWTYDFNQPPSGTNPVLMMDIYPGYSGSSPEHFFIFDSILYFQADDGAVGSELW